MAEAYKALPMVMEHEGGFVDDPVDRGGVTNFGISLRFLRSVGVDIDGDGDIDAEDIRKITREQAKTLFVAHFWRFDALVSQELANKLFDVACNMGLASAVKLAQRALNGMGWNLAVDGQWGTKTATAANSVPAEAILREIRALQATRYAEIAVADPTQKRFLLGWMRRTMA